MFKVSKTSRAIKSTLILCSLSIASTSVFAQDTKAKDEDIERIEITGSSIKRADMEGALPVATISKTEILNSGAVSVPDLISQIPAMQGFTTASDSVGGGGGGIQDASLRDLGSEYTLVLLNGRRMASADSGGTIDLNSIPLAAIERIEILKDGASALYGSDAIAGVVNFIMKKDYQDTAISARYDKPQESGGTSYNFSVSTGFGDLDTDGYNFIFSYSRDDREQLKSSDRDFAATGLVPFTYQDTDLIFQRTSANAIPGNAYLTFNNLDSRSFNPYREENGQCADKNAPEGTTCIYDFTETLEIFPESTRDNVFTQVVAELNENMEVYSTVSWSKFDMISRIAPYPTGTFSIPIDSQLVQENIIPHLSAEEIADLNKVNVRWRTRPGGNRTDSWETVARNITTGIRGNFDEIDYDLSFTYSDSERDNTRITGYPLEEELMSLLESGQVNIFDTPENLSPEANQAIANTMYSGPWETTKTRLKVLEGKASMPIYELDAGEVYLGFGFDYRESEYGRSNSEANDAEIILFESASPEFDLSRETYGMFAETVVPIIEGLEVTAAVRYDNIGEITDTKRAGDQTVGEDKSDTTYKLSLAYRPTDAWLIRASLGTGFKAATMRQIAEPRIEFGVTSSSYACPFSSSDPMAQFCFDELIQYDVFREGYAALRSETSKQRSVGFVYSPDTAFSMSIDWWQVNMEDQVTRLEEGQIFGDPVTYRDLFTTKINQGTGEEVLAIIQAAVNIGESNNQGVDWAFNLTQDFSFGSLKSSVNGTYMIESESLRVGTDNTFDTSLGRFGDNNEVTFRNIIQFNNTLTHDDFSHSLNMSYRSGYDDQYHAGGSTRIRLADNISERYAGGVQLSVPSYMTFNYLTKYHFDDHLKLGFGIKNVFDKQPPLSLRTGGAGHQVGYDPRYTDVLGRTFYLTADYSF
ncbi:TonB-dependent receptor [Flocculibacter collagenilyticus]|uniref:TonB-dependent receptor n=1 Tax=Flocculibacter collagenilyticus TaxID=2744479 RepID=UPI0018F3F908|nr:TonB-dependent receptor [Flocculibacter collagenilyticus]